jgi:hypothetical protein
VHNCSSHFVVLKSFYAAAVQRGDWIRSFEIKRCLTIWCNSNFIKPCYSCKQKGYNCLAIKIKEFWYWRKNVVRNKSQQKSPYIWIIKNIARLSQHVCATCWLKKQHPECSNSCQYSSIDLRIDNINKKKQQQKKECEN